MRKVVTMLEPGADAPDFTATNQYGRDVTLSGHRGRRVLIWFFPKASTPG